MSDLTQVQEDALAWITNKSIVYIPSRKSRFRTEYLAERARILKELVYKDLVRIDWTPSCAEYDGEPCLVYYSKSLVSPQFDEWPNEIDAV